MHINQVNRTSYMFELATCSTSTTRVLCTSQNTKLPTPSTVDELTHYTTA